MLLVYLPFAGVVSLWLYPSPFPTLFKDLFFVIPAYLAFFRKHKKRPSQERIPSAITFSVLMLTLLVFVQSFNPGVSNWLVAAIGSKVWLFYLPLTYLTFAMIEAREDLIRLLRVMVVIAWIPCCIGLIQWIVSMKFGYRETMLAFYGDAAEVATQNYSSFDIGGIFFRIPSTFTFVTQYFGFTLAMIVPTYALMNMDPCGQWRKFSTLIFGLVIVASFISGARSAFLFVPILLALIYLLEGRITGLLKLTFIIPLTLMLSLFISEVNPIILFNLMVELFLMYSDDIARKGIVDAISIAPLGIGTGMNSGAARFAFDDPGSVTFGFGIENYYAKAVYELGIIGLFIVITLFLGIVSSGYRIHRSIRQSELKNCSSALLAFIIMMALSSFKGFQIDLDPINVYFWVFSGCLLKLGYIDRINKILKKS